MPEVSAESILGGEFMTDFEEYTLDQFPLRDAFRQLKAAVHYNLLDQKDNNGIYIAGGQAAQLEYPLNEPSVEKAMEKFNGVYERYLQDAARVVVSVVPDKGYYLAAEHGYPVMDYETLFESVRSGMPWAEYVDITDLLAPEDYYTTDTHWRQEKLLDVAQRLCGVLETAMPTNEEFTAEALERPFYGVYCGQAAVPMEADTMYLLRSDKLDRCTVYNHETQGYGAVYDMEKLQSKDLYDVYLSGAAALLTIENPTAASDRELIVFRDSFGSALTPLLVSDYKTVTLVDLRYISPDLLGQYVDFEGRDVLFLYSTLVLNNSSTLK
ncbi:MAG: hypothetical protein IJ375_06530 [Oscillospiraceae bacterium]|nr:hypothetical protein [Oscillospiraceae bacterium]